MPLKLYIGVTDRDWYKLLRRLPELEEVNFWAPGGTPFKALSAGELFLFKLHAPDHYIVGGGIFAYSNSLPCSFAWETFGQANGARTGAEMRTRIARPRRADPRSREDFVIGCRILSQPFFLKWPDWIPVPSWARQIVQGEDLLDRGGRRSRAVGAGCRPPAVEPDHPRDGTLRHACTCPAAARPGRLPAPGHRHL